MSGIDHLLTLAGLYEGHTGVQRVTLSWRVFGDSKKLEAIAGGKDIQVRRYEKAVVWFSSNWPDDLDWPASITRPPPDPDAAAARRTATDPQGAAA